MISSGHFIHRKIYRSLSFVKSSQFCSREKDKFYELLFLLAARKEFVVFLFVKKILNFDGVFSLLCDEKRKENNRLSSSIFYQSQLWFSSIGRIKKAKKRKKQNQIDVVRFLTSRVVRYRFFSLFSVQRNWRRKIRKLVRLQFESASCSTFRRAKRKNRIFSSMKSIWNRWFWQNRFNRED